MLAAHQGTPWPHSILSSPCAPAGGWMGFSVTKRLGAPGGSGCRRLAQYDTHTAALQRIEEEESSR